MTDLTRRPGDTPPPESTRTTPGTDRGAENPLAAAHPRPAGTTPTDSGRTSGPETAEPSRAATGTGPGHRLLPHDDTDKLTAQLQHAVAGFVDAPRDAVREADDVLRELTERFTAAVTERRRTLRRSWQTPDTTAPDTTAPDEGGPAAATDTEQLRLALRDYRELAERLLRT